MNKNVENYKKAVDQIHVDPKLKNKVLEETKNKRKNPIYYFKYVTAIAVVAIVAVVGVGFANKSKEEVLKDNKNEDVEQVAKADIRRFESIEELKDVLKENKNNDFSRKTYFNDVVEEDAISLDSAKGVDSTETTNTNVDYSRTNNQVESVDEADIVKTDGKYIYYSQNNKVYIVDTDLKLKSTIEDKDFYPRQIFVNGNKLVVFGNARDNNGIIVYNTIDNFEEDGFSRENVSTIYRPKTFIRIYDLKNIEEPKMTREIKVDGNYQDARMIENSVYLVTNYYTYFYNEIDDLKDIDILPSYEDSASKGVNYIKATDIAYFEHTKDTNYSLIVGIDLDSKDDICVETFFGSGSEIYVSENNLYLITPNGYYWDAKESTIYKFKLEDSKVLAVASGIVKGYVDSQFAIDEYKGKLRVATTSWGNSRKFLFSDDYKNHYRTYLTIFDENLEKIGGIDDLIKDEEIYAVRFIGKVGYIVTFQEVDPLWVIDLSDPTNPVVKGELEIPGYSSYLHPYDETHIIGIGYNVKDNGYGGVVNDTIKISMFDVSDVKHPKEIFKKTLDNNSAYSSIMYEHKALFFNKEENLIGFPVDSWNERENKSGLILYRIDMENNKFEEIDDLLESREYDSMERAIYIGDAIYTIYMNQIVKYDLYTFRKLDTLELEYDEYYNYRYY